MVKKKKKSQGQKVPVTLAAGMLLMTLARAEFKEARGEGRQMNTDFRYEEVKNWSVYN